MIGYVKMDKRESIFKLVTDERILILIVGIAILWRCVLSSDETISFWECVCSGITLFIMGWLLFAYMYSTSRKQTDWPVTTKIYQGIAASLLVLNIYVVIYYGMRWFRLLHEEVYIPLDFVFCDIRYLMFLLCYCSVLWTARYLKAMRDKYRLLIKEEPKSHAMSMKESVLWVTMHERTLTVIVIAAILWRVAISLDHTITFRESAISCVILLLLGWFLFGYVCALSVKARRKIELTRVIQGIAAGLMAINIYAIFYYGMSWYVLILGMGDVSGTYVPFDLLFRDIRYIMLVIFYCTAIVLSKFLDKAYTDYTVPINKSANLND
uniref:Uncharacterized protein n=1 Tax=Candidatus Methanophaga sp. ANME-1 ERB7 TaxID=2759913 RepID=A0A7G9ZAE9_9EURY|nr:hypothetical protein ALKFPMEL_00015 [Methanosarcinales archaeon ANME-1 ERB7]